MRTKYLAIVTACWIIELLILGYFLGAGIVYACISILIPLLLFYTLTWHRHHNIRKKRETGLKCVDMLPGCGVKDTGIYPFNGMD